MRLIDLKPHWIALATWVPKDLFAVGVSFLCPHCPLDAPEHGPDRRRRLVCRFWPPIDPAGWLPKISYPRGADTHTRVSGDTFDTLTIEPSIGYESIGHWHGRITKGAIT